MRNKFGMHLPNAQPYDPDTLLSVGFDTYFGLHEQIGLMRQIRERQPDALIVLRYYHENCMSLAPSDLAGRIVTSLWDEARGRGNANPVTWHICPANELNLSVEHGNDGGDWSSADAYRQINQWLLEVARELLRVEPRLILHFPALSPGHSEDQPDRGFVGLDLCREAVATYDWFDDHAYWTDVSNVLDEYAGGRYRKKLAWLEANGFGTKPVLITETNRVVSWGSWLDRFAFAQELTGWYQALGNEPQVHAGCYFIWRGAGPNASFTIANRAEVIDRLRSAASSEKYGGETVGPAYAIGPGVLAELAKRNDMPVSDEQWIGDVLSVTAGSKGLYIWHKQAARVYFLPAQG